MSMHPTAPVSLQECDPTHLAMLLSPANSESDRRLRLGSEQGLDLSDADLQFTSSQPIFSSSQMDTAVFDPISLGGGVAGLAPIETCDAGASGSVVLPPMVTPSSLSSGVMAGKLSALKKNSPSGWAVNETSKTTRHCVFLYQDWPNDHDVITGEIQRIVKELRVLREKSTTQGITLTEAPTFFPNKAGRGIYLVLTSSSTWVQKWKQVAETIRCQYFRPIFREPSVKSGKHGFESLAKIFEMTSVEVTELHLNRVTCDELPTGRKRKTNKKGVAAEEESARPAKQSKLSLGKKRSERTRAAPEDSENAPQQPEPAGNESRHGFRMIRERALSDDSGSVMPAVEMPREGEAEERDLYQICIDFVTSRTPVLEAQGLLRKIDQLIGLSGGREGQVAKYISFFVNDEMLKAFTQFVVLQTQTLEVLRCPPISIPVESLTTAGIVRDHSAWGALKEKQPELHDTLIEWLDFLNNAMGDFFMSLPHPHLDPVSKGFFIASHILGKSRLDKTPLLYLTLRAITQDLRRLFVVIKSLSDFLHAHTDVKLLNSGVQSMLIIAVDTPIEQLFADWVPESLKEFALCEITHTDVKRARVARFEQTIKNMKTNHRLDAGKGKAEELFSVMQESSPVFRAMTTSHEMYSLLSSASSDHEALAKFYKKIRTSGTLL